MKLFTKEIVKNMPKFGTNQHKSASELVFYCKLFTPWSNWTWYVAEANFETGEAFGLVEGFERELGYFDLNEIQEIRGPGGLRIERDMWFSPKSYNDLRQYA